MSLFDFLKRKKEVVKSKAAKENSGFLPRGKKPLQTEKKAENILVEKKEPAPAKIKHKKTGSFSYDVVKEPHISEKAAMLSDKNQYVFKVYPDANKIEIKKAVEGIYGVDVLSVNIIKIPKKKRRLGRTQGFKAGCVKAIVKIKEGQKIEIL